MHVEMKVELAWQYIILLMVMKQQFLPDTRSITYDIKTEKV